MIDTSALNTGADFSPPDTESLTEAWRQTHFAAQVAAELGKSWAGERPDDSHSTMMWVVAGDWRGLEGVPAEGPRPYRARLGFETLDVSVVDGQGGTIARLSLPERTLEVLRAVSQDEGWHIDWIRRKGREIADREGTPERFDEAITRFRAIDREVMEELESIERSLS